MGKRQKKPPSKPSNAYLISFGDTMTAMLAFFIVLNTLAKEQTGANLHAGTGSFVAALSSMGLPGSFSGDNSKNISQKVAASPTYIVNDGDPAENSDGYGPDDEDDPTRIMDRDLEVIRRQMMEFEARHETDTSSEESTAVAIDLFSALGSPDGKGLLPQDARRSLLSSMGIVSRDAYRLEVIVWAPTPSRSAVGRTTEQAMKLAQEIRETFPILGKTPDKVRGFSSLWAYSDEKRPVLTLVFVKIR